jgi:hypothetical protein
VGEKGGSSKASWPWLLLLAPSPLQVPPVLWWELPRLYWCQDLVTARNHNAVLHEAGANFDLPLCLVMSSTPPPWVWCLSYLHDALPPFPSQTRSKSPLPCCLSTLVNRQGIEETPVSAVVQRGENLRSVIQRRSVENTCVLLPSRFRTPASSTAAGWPASLGKGKRSWPGKEKGVSLLRPCGGPPSGPTAGKQAPWPGRRCPPLPGGGPASEKN